MYNAVSILEKFWIIHGNINPKLIIYKEDK